MINLFDDSILGFKKKSFWLSHGLNDIKKNYRRKFLGQFWITINALLFILAIYFVFRYALADSYDNYLIYLSIGYVIWLYMSGCINSSSTLFFQNKAFLLNKYWPLSAFVLRSWFREILVFSHNIMIIPFVFLYYGMWPGLESLFFSIAGLLLMLFTSFWVIILISITATRFPDLSEIISSLMRIFFFISPVIWVERSFGKFAEILLLVNPFAYFIKIIRDPLLGYPVSIDAWIVSISLAIIVMICALILLKFNKHKLTYWL